MLHNVVLITIGEWSFKFGHSPSEGIVPRSSASGSSLLDTLLGVLVAQPRRTPPPLALRSGSVTVTLTAAAVRML